MQPLGWYVRIPHNDPVASSPGSQLICQRQGPMPAMVTKDDEDAEFPEHTHSHLPDNPPCALGHDAGACIRIKPRPAWVFVRLTAKCPRHVYSAVADARKPMLHQPPVLRVNAQRHHHASLDIPARRRRTHRANTCQGCCCYTLWFDRLSKLGDGITDSSIELKLRGGLYAAAGATAAGAVRVAADFARDHSRWLQYPERSCSRNDYYHSRHYDCCYKF